MPIQITIQPAAADVAKGARLFGLPQADPAVPQLPAGVSLCMIVKNEEHFLPGCLESIRGVVDEINIVDTGSTDRTIEIAESYGANIIHREWRNDFSWARNESLAMATKRWILVLDADEELAPESVLLLRELRTIEAAEDAIYVQIVNDVEDQTGIGTFTHMLQRVFPANPKLRFENAIHETIKMDGKPLMGHISGIKILHRGYTSDIVEAKKKAERNLPLLQRELKEKRDDPFALFNFGMNAVNLQLEYLDEGIEALEAMVASGTEMPFAPIGYNALASALANHKGKGERALELLDEAERRFPPDANLMFTRGQVLVSMKRFADGREAWQKLLDSRDELRYRALVDDEMFEWKAPFNIGLSFIAEDRKREALPWIARALKSKPNSTFVVSRYARTLEEAGSYFDAETQYRHWAELDPVQGALEQIRYLLRRERYMAAAELLEQSKKMPTAETVQVTIVLADKLIAAKTGRPEDLLESALRLEPANGDALRMLEKLLGERGDTARLAQIRAAELEGECRDAVDFARRSLRLMEFGRYAESLVAAERALELDPDHCAAAYNKALATAHLGDRVEAGRLFDLVPSSDLQIFGAAMTARAQLLGESGDVDGALAAISRWTNADPANVDAILTRAKILTVAGRDVEAEAALRARAWSDRRIALELTGLLLRLGRVADAGDVATQALR